MMKTKTITALFLALTGFTLHAQWLPVNGNIDSTFGTNGMRILSDPTEDIEASIIQYGSDGKYYVANNTGTGMSRNVLLASYTSNGILDNSYGANGKVIFDPLIGGSDYAMDMKLDPNNRLVVVGRSYTINGQYFISRFLPNGTLDTSFNHSGTVTGGGSFDDFWSGCAIEPNGDITTVGALSDGDGSNKVIARYKANGTLDSAFGFNGMNVLDESAAESFKLIYRKNSNRYYLVGQTNGVDKLYAYDGSGNLISSFGNAGKYTFNQIAGQRVYVLDMALEGNDVYFSGYTRNMQTNQTNLLVGKMNQNGLLDNNFGFNGYYNADMAAGNYDYASEIKILADGSIFLAGNIYDANDMGITTTFLLASDGTLYSSYGTNGMIHYPIANSENTFLMHMTEDSQGRLAMLLWNVAQGGKLEAIVMRLKTTVSGIGIEELSPRLMHATTYPNPATESLYVTLHVETNSVLTFSLIDISGSRLATKTLDVNSGENTLDLTELIIAAPAGMYLLSITNQETPMATLKVVKR
jgi:uncharacterized delta-60 repeat protein